jgi:hypothetical protein
VARPENRSEVRALNLTLPEEAFNCLILLATLGKLAPTENEVATHILVREAHAMHQRGFHEQRIPRGRSDLAADRSSKATICDAAP